MSSNLVTARECIKAFEDIGVTMSEPSFSKYKKRGVFKTYSIEGKKRDMFNLGEVLTTYFEVNLPTNKAEQKRRDQYYIQKKEREKRKERFDNISIEWDKLAGYEVLTLEMFDIKDLWINAADDLKELKGNELRGEIISDEYKEIILKAAAKTQKEHTEEFKREIFAQNEANQYLMDFILEALFDDLGKKYTGFRMSTVQLDILKSANDWIVTPEKMADFFGIDLLTGEPKKS